MTSQRTTLHPSATLAWLLLAGALHAQSGIAHDLTGGVPLLWDAVGASATSSLQSAVAVGAGGSRVYALTTSGGNSLVAIDEASGLLLWETEVHADLFLGSPPAGFAVDTVNDQILLRRSPQSLANGTELVAFSASTGAQLWSASTPGLIEGRPSAVVADGIGTRVFSVATRALPQGFGLRLEGRLAPNGAPLWASEWVFPAAGGAGIVYVGDLAASSDGSLCAITWRGTDLSGYPPVVTQSELRVHNGLTGALLWSFPVGKGASAAFGPVGPVAMALAADGSRVAAVNAQGGLTLFTGTTGAVLWNATASGTFAHLALAPDSSVLYAAINEASASPILPPTRISAYRVSDGALLWSVTETPWGPGVWQSPVDFEVSPDGSRLALYVVGGGANSSSIFNEALSVLFETSSGTRIGGTAPGTGMDSPAGAGATYGDLFSGSLAFSASGTELVALGSGPGVAPQTGEDLWFERLDSQTGTQLPRFELDLLDVQELNATGTAVDAVNGLAFHVGLSGSSWPNTVIEARELGPGTVSWTRQFPQPTNSLISKGIRTVAAGDGGLVFMSERRVDSATLRALDSQTGADVWEHTLPMISGVFDEALYLALSPDSKIVYLAFEEPNADHLRAIDAATGLELWTETDPAGLIGSIGTNAVSMTVDNSQVYLFGRTASTGTGGQLNRAAALDATTGSVNWSSDNPILHPGTGDTREPAWISAFDGKLALLEELRVGGTAAHQTRVRVLDAATGSELLAVSHDLAGVDLRDLRCEASSKLGLIVIGGTSDLGYLNGSDVFLRVIDEATGLLLHDLAYDLDYKDRLGELRVAADGGTVFIAMRQSHPGAPFTPPAVSTVAVDPVSGATLWSAEYTDGSAIAPNGLAVSPAGDAVVIAVGGSVPGIGAAYGTPALIGSPQTLSLSAGGQQQLQLVSGTAHAAEWHFVLGSATGTTPGTPLGAFTLPLNADAYLALTVASPGAPVGGALGQLSASGVAQASFDLPAGTSPGLAGLELNHAFATIRFQAGAPAVTSVSNAVPVLLAP